MFLDDCVESSLTEANCNCNRGIYYSCIVSSNLFSAFSFHVEDLRD